MTEAEKEELKKLSVDDLVELIDTEREARKKSETTFANERKEIISKFLNGADEEEDEGDGTSEERDLTRDKAFQKLKKKIF